MEISHHHSLRQTPLVLLVQTVYIHNTILHELRPSPVMIVSSFSLSLTIQPLLFLTSIVNTSNYLLDANLLKTLHNISIGLL
ncbi:hypothetical protein AcW1_006591 [Taiwanofungus camphoratus]|nr:hypothetical protein AcV5_009177 [Antrodia cinnamomea]KAI0924475.1 hypothetical protein AcW2_005352 [Antrodia cinnamomea]KAI0940682.1 hypothetical protein AcV7_002995 [Antrodia cinnamomea]KAI0954813.1 hypothetical protein AcW1_006591 [Antrodia cinnamomea]